MPAIPPLNTIVVMLVPEQIVCDAGVAVAELAGQPITSVYVALLPEQPLASVAVTIIGKEPLCVGVPLNTPAGDNVIPVGNVLAVVKV